jgi:hypothetical protein
VISLFPKASSGIIECRVFLHYFLEFSSSTWS